MKRLLTLLATGLLAVAAVQGQTVVNFTAAEWATAQGIAAGGTMTSFTKDGVTVGFSAGSATLPTYNGTQQTVAAVSGSTMTISAPDGYVVTEAAITMYATSQASNLASATWSAGKAEASKTTTTWTGNVQSVTVTLKAVARFVSFSITVDKTAAPPVPEDTSKYNDTTAVTITEWMADEGYGTNDLVDATSFQKDGKTFTARKESGNQLRFYSRYLGFYQNNTLTLTAPCLMHKVVLTFYNAEHATYFLEGGWEKIGSTCSSGTFKKDEADGRNVIWLGSTAELVITFGYTVRLMSFTIYSDKTADKTTVTFIGLDGKEQKTEQVNFGSSATAPALPVSTRRGWVIHWDKDFSRVTGDLTVRAVEEPAVSLDLRPTQCDSLHTFNRSTGLSFTSGNATFTLKGDRDEEATNWARSEGKVVIFANTTITISTADTLRTVRLTALGESDAERLAAAGYSSGKVTRNGKVVAWRGETQKLTITYTGRSCDGCWGEESGVTRFEAMSIEPPVVVTFLDRDGNVLKTDTIESGQAPTAPTPPTIEGLTFTGWSVDVSHPTEDVTTQAQYTLADGYVEVTFTDYFGNPIETQRVRKGASTTAPAAPALIAHTFTGWSAGLDNLQASVTIQAQYTFNPAAAGILTVAEARSLASKQKQKSEIVVVKGLVSYAPEELTEGGRLTFAISDDGNHSDYLQIYEALNSQRKPFTSTKQIMVSDTIYAVGTMYNEDGWNIRLIDGFTAHVGRAGVSGNMLYFDLPEASSLYDFAGNGTMQAPLQTDLARDIRQAYIDDLNGDGRPDICDASQIQTWLSSPEGYTRHDTMFMVANMDLNLDGRLDYIVLNNEVALNLGYTHTGDIAYQLPDGTFRRERMQAMTWSEYLQQMSDEERDMMNNPQNYSLGDVSRYTYTATLGGAALSRAPRRRHEPMHAPGIGHKIGAPTKAIDLNGDGLVDLIDEKNGVILTNMGNGKWVMTKTNGIIIPADLNADGIVDFIFPGATLYTSVYDKSSNAFQTTTLYQNAAVDDLVYCYDFDRDGDIDILATFSSATNSTGYAYTCFFRNDGKGNFTRQAEQDYGNNKLWFSALQDIDGDGYYDLLALRGDIISWSGHYQFDFNSTAEVVVLRGNSNMQFAAPEAIAAFSAGGLGVSGLTVNAEDLDNDGRMDIWLSGRTEGMTELIPQTSARANTRPQAPARPALSYDNGQLTVTWANGTDAETTAADLTYALRIGTTTGSSDILSAHANADGRRRNFLDGNMGRLHKYTIDLRSYPPSTIYASIQAIDAQHAGSPWSDEATVQHTYVPADFTLDRTAINLNQSAQLIYTALPAGYTHQWTVQDGSYEPISGSDKLLLRFTSGGTKTITHTVITPQNTIVTATGTINVLPAGVGEKIPIEYDRNSTSALLQFPMADFTYDGRLDGVQSRSYSSGAYYDMTVMQGVNTSALFTQAAGLWNTNILSNSLQSEGYGDVLWYDYDRDGNVDLLFKERLGSSYGKMLHDATSPALTARVDDNDLVYLFDYSYYSYPDYYEGYSLYRDLTHDGRYDYFISDRIGYHQLIVPQDDGNRLWQEFTVDGDADLFQEIIAYKSHVLTADFDHDGFVDIAGMNTGSTDQYGNALTYGSLTIFFNRGNGRFEQKTLPLAEEVSTRSRFQLADLNGDGYPDLIGSTARGNDDELFINVMWNSVNQSFSAPVQLPGSNAANGYASYQLSDIDNNGYLDITTTMSNPAAGDDAVGTYVWFFGREGVMNHGFLLPEGGSETTYYLATDEHYLSGSGGLYPIVSQADLCPSAPTGLQASMTADGLLITWDAATDDHTPAALMRYNLSVRQKGASTYLISPQNGGNSQAAWLPGYDYVEATRFLIPTAYLSNADYEISIQALDRQNKLSDFCPTVTAHVQRNPIEAPTSACAANFVTVSYRGAATSATPVWNFDGATIQSGSGFGPYTIYWNYRNGGTKTISLTVDGQTYTHSIDIDDPSTLAVSLPTVLYEETAAAASVPDGVSYEWYARVDDGEICPITESGIRLPSTSSLISLDRRLTASGLTVTAHRNAGNNGTLVGHTLVLYLKVENQGGCEVWFQSEATLMASTAIPTLALVTTDEDGHNVITWTNADAFTSINIYKEATTLGNFQLIGTAAASAGSFTDPASDAAQRAERYRITGLTASGAESPASTVHQTVHLTISRGVLDGTYNLMWNSYAGAGVTGYNILRGASPRELTQVASLASSNTSYTDQAPSDEQPYYAIEYVLAGEESQSVQSGKSVQSVESAEPTYSTDSLEHSPRQAPAAATRGRSNVVDRRSGLTALDEVQATGQSGVQKVIRNGKLYLILPDGRTFDSLGREAR